MAATANPRRNVENRPAIGNMPPMQAQNNAQSPVGCQPFPGCLVRWARSAFRPGARLFLFFFPFVVTSSRLFVLFVCFCRHSPRLVSCSSIRHFSSFLSFFLFFFFIRGSLPVFLSRSRIAFYLSPNTHSTSRRLLLFHESLAVSPLDLPWSLLSSSPFSSPNPHFSSFLSLHDSLAGRVYKLASLSIRHGQDIRRRRG